MFGIGRMVTSDTVDSPEQVCETQHTTPTQSHILTTTHCTTTQALVIGYMRLDGVQQQCPDMLSQRLAQMVNAQPVQWSLFREIGDSISKVTTNMERSSLRELRLNEVEGVDNTPLIDLYKKAAPKAKGNKRKLSGSSPTYLWNRNGPEMTALGTIADLKIFEADKEEKAMENAARKTKTFVDKVITHSCKIYILYV